MRLTKTVSLTPEVIPDGLTLGEIVFEKVKYVLSVGDIVLFAASYKNHLTPDEESALLFYIKENYAKKIKLESYER